MTTYKESDVWIQSMELARQVYELTKEFPTEEKYGIGDQCRRSAVLVASKIAEAYGGHKKETIQCLHLSRGSLYELDTLLNIAHRLGIIEEVGMIHFSAQVEKCLRLIRSLIRYFEKSDLR